MSPRVTSARKSLRLLIASGVNLDLLGQREPQIYGNATLQDVLRAIQVAVPTFSAVLGLGEADVTFFQSNDEAEFLARLSEGWDGAVINPGAWTHTSLALGDRLAALALPFVEVHMSNLARREPVRHVSYSAPYALGVVYGFGVDSYITGLYGLLSHLAKNLVPHSRPKSDAAKPTKRYRTAKK